MNRVLCFALLCVRYHSVSARTRDASTVLSDSLMWEYRSFNPNCESPTGRNPCRDIRICKFALASMILGGQPARCGSVGPDVPKVCCGLPLVLGENLMNKVKEEKARNRECGRKTYSAKLSETENRFLGLVKNLPDFNLTNPNKYGTPLDLKEDTMVSSVGLPQSRQDEFPWMVAIFYVRRFWCGGTLIDRVHVLAEAHCFFGEDVKKDPSLYTVTVGNVASDGGVPFQVSDIRIHERYDPTQHANDIAILKLSSEILEPLIAHICLPSGDLSCMSLEGRAVTRLGWGKKEYDFISDPPILYIVDGTNVVSNEECNEIYSAVNDTSIQRTITNDFLCVTSPEGRKEECEIYSDGPLMYNNNQETPSVDQWVLVGLGHNCTDPGFPGVYTRISSHTDWIKQNTK